MQKTAVTMDPPRTFRRVPRLPHQMTSKLTAQRDLFVLAHVGIPRVDASAWTLRISGLLRKPGLVYVRRDPANAEN